MESLFQRNGEWIGASPRRKPIRLVIVEKYREKPEKRCET